MPSYNKFDRFTYDVIGAKHDFNTHVFKVMLTNTAPVASNQTLNTIVEIAAGNGYAAGGNVVGITVSSSGATAAVSGLDTVITATGTIGPFRYAVLYNDTQSDPAKPLISWWDYGSSITLAATEILTVDFDAVNGIFQLT